MSEADARRAALVELGGVEQVKEEVRAGRAGFALETFLMDVRYGFRAARILFAHSCFHLCVGQEFEM
ncbi:MAG: hypothetical protein ACJ8HQ_09685 [Chthoniobacterales bacterium]